MHFKKVLLAILSVAYTLVLVHNLTPHRHHNSSDELNSETSPLKNWLHFIFGSEHEKSVQDEDHLTKYLLSEDNDCDELSAVFQCDDYDFLQSCFSEIFISGISAGLLSCTENTFLPSGINLTICQNSAQISGRAPPADLKLRNCSQTV